MQTFFNQTDLNALMFPSAKGGQVGVVVSCLAFHLKDPGSNHTGGTICGLGFQSIPDCVGFPWKKDISSFRKFCHISRCNEFKQQMN